MDFAKTKPSETSPAILPCGHVACKGCMNLWVKQHKSCPFCREKMKHHGCRHTVNPVLITFDTVHTLPKTLPRGGVISRRCADCVEEKNRDVLMSSWRQCAKKYREVRQGAEAKGLDEAVREMKEIENVIEEKAADEALRRITERRREW